MRRIKKKRGGVLRDEDFEACLVFSQEGGEWWGVGVAAGELVPLSPTGRSTPLFEIAAA